jgi:hypothetical protein
MAASFTRVPSTGKGFFVSFNYLKSNRIRDAPFGSKNSSSKAG